MAHAASPSRTPSSPSRWKTTLAGLGLLALLGPGCASIQRYLPASLQQKKPPAPLEMAKTQGFHSELHELHAGKVVFAREQSTLENHASVTYVDAFTLPDPVYMRVFLADSFGNAFRKQGLECQSQGNRLLMRVQIDDAPEKEWLYAPAAGFDEEPWNTWTTTSFYPQSLTGNEGGEPLTLEHEDRDVELFFTGAVLPRLKVGENRLTFHAIANCNRAKRGDNYEHDIRVEVATGSLTLHVPSEEARQRFWAQRGPLLPKPNHEDQKTLEKLALKWIGSNWTNENPKRVIVTSSRYHVTHHEIHGQPLRRSVAAQALVQLKATGICRLFDISLIQAYAGEGQYHDDRVEVAVGSNKEFPCYE